MGLILTEYKDIDCQYYRPPKYYVDPETDKDYEGSAWCDLSDKYCLVEYGDECEEYNEYLKEVKNG